MVSQWRHKFLFRARKTLKLWTSWTFFHGETFFPANIWRETASGPKLELQRKNFCQKVKQVLLRFLKKDILHIGAFFMIIILPFSMIHQYPIILVFCGLNISINALISFSLYDGNYKLFPRFFLLFTSLSCSAKALLSSAKTDCEKLFFGVRQKKNQRVK